MPCGGGCPGERLANAKGNDVERAQKVELVADLNATFQQAGSVLVTHFSGLSVAEISDLRRRMREAGARFRVTKNRLVRRAIEGTTYAPLAEMFNGPTAIAYSDDPIAVAKVAVGYAKDNSKLVVLGGAMAETLLDAAAVKALAALPSLDEIRGQMVALLQTPAMRMVTLLQAPAGQLARVLGAHAAQHDEPT